MIWKKIKNYIEILKSKYQNAIITREFHNDQNILVRATEINYQTNKENIQNQKNRERDIRQRGER